MKVEKKDRGVPSIVVTLSMEEAQHLRALGGALTDSVVIASLQTLITVEPVGATFVQPSVSKTTATKVRQTMADLYRKLAMLDVPQLKLTRKVG